ncbi:MAG: hypothetical protein AB7K68_10285 [Bacteriovoracia bacterium]
MACQLCAAPKDTNTCEACEARVCKNCVVFNNPERYRFHPAPPAELKREIFCVDCFERDAAPALAEYDAVLERSKEVKVISKLFRGPVPLVKQARVKTTVNDHVDVNIATMHLKFLCAWENYDSVVKFESEATKVRNHGYQKMSWRATGLFVLLDHRRFRPEG